MALDKNCKDTPYLLGRLTAIIAKSIGITASQYSKAMSTPLSILPYLIDEYHRKGDTVRPEEFAAIMSELPSIPAGLTVIQQGQWIIGHDHELADIYREENRRKVAKAIKLKRAELDMTQAQLAEKAGITKQTVGSIESGDSNVSLDVISSVMAVLGIRLDIG